MDPVSREEAGAGLKPAKLFLFLLGRKTNYEAGFPTCAVAADYGGCSNEPCTICSYIRSGITKHQRRWV